MVTIECPLLAHGSRKILSNKAIKVRLCYKSEGWENSPRPIEMVHCGGSLKWLRLAIKSMT